MEGEDDLLYESLKQDTIKEDCEYDLVELSQTSAVEERRAKEPKNYREKKQQGTIME